MRMILGAIVASAIAFAGPAGAQTTTDSVVTQQATPVAPPDGTLATTREHRSVDAYGNRVDSTSSTYRNSQGVAEDSRTTTTTVAPPPPPVSSTTTTTTRSTTTAPN